MFYNLILSLGLATEDDGLCPSMYSFHSSPEEKNKLLYSLTQYGIETTVDRGAKKDRIRAWIENSIIDEEEEDGNEEEGDTDNEERVGILDNETGPVGERMDRGPIQTNRATKVAGKTMDDKQKRREIRDAIISKRNSAIYIPPVDPRIPLEQQRLSRSEIQLNAVVPPPPNKYFEKFSSKIANDLIAKEKIQNNSTKKRQEVQKTITTQTSLSNGSNNSNAQSDDSTIVNVISDDSKPNLNSNTKTVVSNTRGSVKQQTLTEGTQTTDQQTNGSAIQRNGFGRYSQTKNRYQMKNRYDIYDNREEKSSSSISNSTGRSVSK